MESDSDRRKMHQEDDIVVKVEVESEEEDDVKMELVQDNRAMERVPQPQQCGPFTNFSIDEILKPSFGRRHNEMQNRRQTNHYGHINPASPGCFSPKASHVLKTSPIFVSHSPPVLKTSPVHASQTSPVYKDENTSPVSSPGTSPGSEGRGSTLPLPAWVYCTRYSDRPSSGKFHFSLHFYDFLVCNSKMSLNAIIKLINYAKFHAVSVVSDATTRKLETAYIKEISFILSFNLYELSVLLYMKSILLLLKTQWIQWFLY